MFSTVCKASVKETVEGASMVEDPRRKVVITKCATKLVCILKVCERG